MQSVLSPFQRRPRLMAALAVGIAAGFVVPHHLVAGEPFRRFLVAWNAAVWSYLLLIGWLIFRANHARTRAISEKEDPGAVLVLTIVSLIAVTSLVAIGAELAAAHGSADQAARYVFAAITLLGSWAMLNVLFGFHYAHLYFRNAKGSKPLRFPDEPPPDPDFWDFLYFSFTIAVAAQTADVAILTGEMRRTVLAHSILAFFFNVAILGATVNVAAGLLSS